MSLTTQTDTNTLPLTHKHFRKRSHWHPVSYTKLVNTVNVDGMFMEFEYFTDTYIELSVQHLDEISRLIFVVNIFSKPICPKKDIECQCRPLTCHLVCFSLCLQKDDISLSEGSTVDLRKPGEEEDEYSEMAEEAMDPDNCFPDGMLRKRGEKHTFSCIRTFLIDISP